MTSTFFIIYVGNLLLPLMGEDFLQAAFAELGPDIAQMVHNVTVHLNPMRPGKLIKGYAFVTFRSSAAAQTALTSIINGVWANNFADPLCLAKTRMIITPVAASPHTARAKLSVSSLANTVDEATLASAFAGCPDFCGQQILRDYNPFGSAHIQKFSHTPTCNIYGKTQTGPLGRAYIYFETATDAAHALRAMRNLVIHDMMIKLQQPRQNHNIQTKTFVKTRTLNPAAAPFVPGRWASKKAALVFPAEMAATKIAAHRVPFRPMSAFHTAVGAVNVKHWI